MIWPKPDLWNISYIILRTSWVRMMKLYVHTNNTSDMICAKFHEIYISGSSARQLPWRGAEALSALKIVAHAQPIV